MCLSNETQDTESVTTFTTYSSFTFNDDETNTIALSDCLSDGHSTIADQTSVLGQNSISEDLEEETLYHDVQPNDTLQGVCLLYGISARELRRANNFRGLNLNQAPERLVIPRNKRDRSKKDFASMTENEKVQTLMSHLPVSRRTKKPLLSYDQARQYLMTNNWNFNQTLRNMQVDMVGLLPSSTKQVRMATRRVR
jgi:LysM repeat protein